RTDGLDQHRATSVPAAGSEESITVTASARGSLLRSAGRGCHRAVALSRTDHPFVTTPDFARLGVPASLVDALPPQGITHPTPIQASTLPGPSNRREGPGRRRTAS